jgi:SSS family solute:Na+ symporter
MLFCMLEEDVIQKILSAKNVITARSGAILAAVGLLCFSLVPLLIGIIAKQSHGFVHSGGSVFIDFLTFNMPKYISVFANIAVILAILSTADSLVCAINASIGWDLLKRKNNGNAEANQACENKSRIITAFICVLSLWISNMVTNVLAIFIESYKLIICTCFVPTLIAYFPSAKKSKNACIVSFICAFITYCVLICIQSDYTALACIVIQFLSYFVYVEFEKHKLY